MFNKPLRKIGGLSLVHVQSIATTEEIEELKKITNKTSNKDMIRALIEEKLYSKKVEV